jgi:hypothetical protein
LFSAIERVRLEFLTFENQAPTVRDLLLG